MTTGNGYGDWTPSGSRVSSETRRANNQLVRFSDREEYEGMQWAADLNEMSQNEFCLAVIRLAVSEARIREARKAASKK